MKIKVSGFRELERALAEELPRATARAVLNRTAIEAMEPMRQRMADLAPYDANDRDADGRHLNETMRTQVPKAATARRLGMPRNAGVIVLTGPAPVGKRARANAGWQERGTVKQAAQAFARPAADSESRGAIDRVKDALTAQIEKAKARIARRAARKGK